MPCDDLKQRQALFLLHRAKNDDSALTLRLRLSLTILTSLFISNPARGVASLLDFKTSCFQIVNAAERVAVVRLLSSLKKKLKGVSEHNTLYVLSFSINVPATQERQLVPCIQYTLHNGLLSSNLAGMQRRSDGLNKLSLTAPTAR
jgi:hypothetical protein